MVIAAPEREERSLGVYELRGGALELFHCREPEILIEGAAGTGKTRACLELGHLLNTSFPGCRGLILRKVGKTLATSTLQTFERFVLKREDGVKWYGGSAKDPPAYIYPNGSTITVGGMDEAGKVLSTEYDWIYVNECNQLLSRQWQTLISRLRGMVLEHPRIIGDCNPTVSSSWLYKDREAGGFLTVIHSYHKDNPAYFHEDGTPTAAGQAYIDERLGRISDPGLRASLLRGERQGVENALYAVFSPESHVRDLVSRGGADFEIMNPGEAVPILRRLTWQTGAVGVDQGRVHSAGAVAVKVDQYGRRWVLEAWGESDPTEDGSLTASHVGRLSVVFQLGRVRTDPTAAKVAAASSKLLGKTANVGAADGSPGARLARVRMVQKLLSVYAGGVVTKLAQDHAMLVPHGPYAADDPHPATPGILFARGGAGIDRLCQQIQAYHFVNIETDRQHSRVVARIDDDLVAALEYAIEELEAEEALPTIVGMVEMAEEAAKAIRVDHSRFPELELTAPPPREERAPEGAVYGLPGRRG